MTNRITIQLLFLVLFMGFSYASFAQVPVNIQVKGTKLQGNPEACSDQFAGNVSFSNFIGQSNDIWGDPTPDTIYMCNGDKFDVSISGQDLTGDPDMSTPGGVGFGFYDCIPSITGPDLTAINADCHYTNAGDYLISTGGSVSGNQTFENTGALQTSLNSGDPICIWFAPITYDQLGANPTYENGGPCVNANIADRFPVVYLNPIDAVNIQNSVGGFDCKGSFTVIGGLSEYDGTHSYSINISLASDPSVKAIIITDPADIIHGKQVRFQVNEAGQYNISISDGKSCQYQGTVTMAGCPTLNIDFSEVSGAPGTNVCLPVTVKNFNNISALEFKIHWDPAIVTFDKITSTNLPSISANATTGEVTFIWLVLPGDVTIADGDEAFQICFDLVGALGTSTPVWIGPNTNGIEISGAGNTRYGLDKTSTEGKVSILTPGAINVALTATPPKCKGEANGSIGIVMDAGSNFPVTVTYTHSSGAPTGNVTINNTTQVNIPNLPEGNYDIHIVDNTNATQDEMIEILEGFQLGVNLPTVTTACYGDKMDICPNAFVLVNGTPNPVTDFTGYTFAWGNNSTQMCINEVPSGFFEVTVTNPDGCSASASGTLLQPAQIQVTDMITDPSCTGVDNGIVDLTASGGTTFPGGLYDYAWESEPVSKSPTYTVSNLSPGTYSLTVTDGNGCSTVESYTLSYQKEIQASVTKQDITCNGSDNGSILATGTTTGGTAALPYAYAWNQAGVTGSNPMNLGPGMYEVTVSDNDGCMATANATIDEPTPLVITLDNIQHESCATGSDGQISISASGGGGAFKYTWSTVPAQTTATATGLGAGTYTVSVEDANTCVQTETYTVLPPLLPTIDDFTITDVNCPTDNNGSLTVNVTNGNGQNLNYNWGGVGNTQTITGLSVGDYDVTVTDEYGCSASSSASIAAAQAFSIVSDTFIKPSCPGEMDGTLLIEMAGSGNFKFEADAWNAGAGNSYTLSGLSAGTYDVTITDLASTCPAIVTSLVLPDPHSIVITTTLQNGVSCFDGSILDGAAVATAEYSDGETGAFNFTWGPNASSCLASTSCVSTTLGINENWVIVDDGQCTVIDTILVGAPDSILVESSTITDASCYKDTDGTISINVIGGNPGYVYGWTGPAAGQNSADVNNLPAGNYTVSVTDAVGCAETFDFVVDEPDSLQLFIDLAQDVKCFGDSTGVISVIPIGGNEDFTFAWTPSSISNSNLANFLIAGTYSVTVTDNKGCTQTLTHELSENPPIFASLKPIEEPECYGYQTVISIDTVTGGSGGNYTYSVDYAPPRDIELDYQIFADSHYVIVYDGNQCQTELFVNVGEPDEIYVNLPPTMEVDLGDSIQLNPIISSSLPIDSFFWTPTVFLMPDSVLHPFVVGLFDDQLYELTVIDENGCEQVAEVLVEVDRNRNVYIPNIFSPNADGFNDIFHPKTGLGVKEVKSMTIYDRWGNLIYAAKNFLPGDNSPEYWDGRFRGKALDPGVFVYLIEVEFLDETVLLYRGSITLMK